jgi:hypothetical protein
MTPTITLIGARGGQGTPTVAAALACLAASDGPVALFSHDPTAMARLLVVPAHPRRWCLGSSWPTSVTPHPSRVG